ncbi:MAG: septum formation initiator family protein [Clostridiales bacterium]
MKQKLKMFTMIFLFIAILGFGEQISKINYLNTEIQNLKAEKIAVAQKIDNIHENIELLETISYVEILARENLNMVYPDEKKYIAVNTNINIMEKAENNQEFGD